MAVIDAVKPNEINEDIKFGWLCEAEARVECEIHKRKADEVDITMSGDRELLVSAPYSKMYSMYLYAMIAFVKGEYDVYAKANAEYEQIFSEYGKYYLRTRAK